MSSDLYADLAWLPQAPDDFRQRCRAVAASTQPGPELQALAGHALAEHQLDRLGRTIEALAAAGTSLAPLIPFRLGLMGNGTLDLLVPTLIASAARHGIALDCVRAGYDQVVQDALDPESAMNLARPDAVLVALDYRGLPLRLAPGDAEVANAGVQSALDQIASVRAGLRQHGGATCILQTLAPPVETIFGQLDRAVPGTMRWAADQFNRELAGAVFGGEDVLLDVAGIAETVGLSEWHSAEQYNMAKLPFNNRFVPLYADHVARLLGAMRGRSRRCLILDLDNTVWGGVIGDDGLEGIRIAQGDAVGEAHLSVQRLALALRDRGVVLAVSSKNDDDVARKPFREHPEMLLKENHFAVFQANWNDKATNIKAIADELALGIGSMVFLDDNPVERNLVRQHLPAVAVPELPADPALYARTLSAAGYFESVTFSDEDRKRASFYENNARRVALQQQVGDLSAYLRSLDMEIMFAPFDDIGRSRISQLINKSNQFNLTTRRYSEADVTDAERDPAAFTLQVRLADKFDDNGMISVIICREAGAGTWELDTWLMSCRVLGRGVERAVLHEILREARGRGIARLVGVFRPTDRNSMVRDHYRKLGFAPIEQAGDETRWELDTTTEIEMPPMRVRHGALPVPETAS